MVVLTWNEAANIDRCLASAAFSDDLWVIDSGSQDDTVQRARTAGAHTLTRPFDSFAAQRNYAMQQTLRHDWVLHLDADEVVTPELRAELEAIASSPPVRFPVYRLPSRLIFMGRWLRHAGMYPAYQVRFGRREALRFLDHGHGQREVHAPDQVGTLQAPLDHYNFSKGINDWFARHLRYALREAEEAARGTRTPWRELLHPDPTQRRRALKALATRLPMRPTLRFAYTYLLRGGILDGRAGYHYARLLGMYQYLIDRNLEELRARLPTPSQGPPH